MTNILGEQVTVKKPIWDIETVAEMVKGIVAIILTGVAIGVVMLVWEVMYRSVPVWIHSLSKVL